MGFSTGTITSDKITVDLSVLLSITRDNKGLWPTDHAKLSRNYFCLMLQTEVIVFTQHPGLRAGHESLIDSVIHSRPIFV